MNWDKIEIVTETGEKVLAQAPIIISASRSTDIPTFYANWFIERWRLGYVKWKNPFNGIFSYVSFKNTRVVVFWTKNPRPMIKHIDFLNENIKNYYFQYTLNDYGMERLEGKVPELETRIETFKVLSNRIGKDRIIWRFDPLLLTDNITVEELLNRVEKIGNILYTYTNKLVFSYADISVYRKVENNLKKRGINYVEFSLDSMIKFAEGLQKLNSNWGLELATCAEKFDLSKYGINHNKCIDDDLMIKLFQNDKILMKFLGVNDCEPNLFIQESKLKNSINLKDKGQREFCGCIMSKDIGEYNTCPHECLYCYANTSESIARSNYENYKLNPNGETITGR